VVVLFLYFLFAWHSVIDIELPWVLLFSVQFGNTCYCNSVLQALYYCKPFRDMVLLYKQQTKNQKKETLLTCLADLFYSVAIQKRKTGSIAPKKFIQRLRKENCKFGLVVDVQFNCDSIISKCASVVNSAFL